MSSKPPTETASSNEAQRGNEREDGEWLLVVDDSPDSQAFYAACLESTGLRSTSAANGNEALELLLERPSPRAIVLDLIMPGMNGFEFLAIVGCYTRLAAVPVLIVTALGEQAEGASSRGVVLRKPVARERLLQALMLLTAQARPTFSA